MRCRYCNRRLNILKSLTGSPFCSKEHQGLFERSQAETAFSRLLEFVEKDAKPAPAPAKTGTPESAPQPVLSAPAEAQPAEQFSQPKTAADEAPAEAGFLAEPVAPMAGAELRPAAAVVEIAPLEFSAKPSGLASLRVEPRETEYAAQASGAAPEYPVPPPVSPIFDSSPEVIKTCKAPPEIQSMSAVRPRAISPCVPFFKSGLEESRQSAPAFTAVLAIGPVNQATAVASLARLEYAGNEVGTAISKAEWQKPAFHGTSWIGQPKWRAFVELNYRAEASRVMRMVGPVIRAVLGRTHISASSIPAMQPKLCKPGQASGAELPLMNAQPVSPVGKINTATNAEDVTKAIRQPPAGKLQRITSSLKTSPARGSIVARLQEADAKCQADTSEVRAAQSNYVMPRALPSVPAHSAPASPLMMPCEPLPAEDASGALRGPARAAVIGSPICVPNGADQAHSPAIAFESAARGVLPGIQSIDTPACASVPARFAQQAARVSNTRHIEWPKKASMSAGNAFLSDMDARDRVAQGFPSEVQAAYRTAMLLAQAEFDLANPVVGTSDVTQEVALERVDWQSRRGLSHSKPAPPSPLSLVALPKRYIVGMGQRRLARVRQFSGITNAAKPSLADKKAEPGSHSERAPVVALPRFMHSGVVLHFSFHRDAKTLPILAAERKSAAGGDRNPSPLRMQPASMLVLPEFSIPFRNIQWQATTGWATITPRLSRNDDQQVVSSHQDRAMPSLERLADALRVDSGTAPQGFRAQVQRVAMLLDLRIKPSAKDITPAHALPRRTGPRLPVVKARLNDLLTSHSESGQKGRT